MQILLPLDGSPYTKQMLGYVAAHEELFGPQHEYIFATVVGPVPPHVTHNVGRAASQGYYKEEADKVLAPVLAFAAGQVAAAPPPVSAPWPSCCSSR